MAISTFATIVETYAEQGLHRTGTATDEACSDWLFGMAQELGLAPEKEAFAFNRIDVETASIEIDGGLIKGMPHFDSMFDDHVAIEGRLAELGADAAIGVVIVPPSGQGRADEAFMQTRKTGVHRAIIAVSDDTDHMAGLTLGDAAHYDDPFGPPVLQISSIWRSRLERAIRDREEGVFRLVTRRCDTSATNVVATVPGTVPGLRPVVVLTPISGWWASAAERGGGVATWVSILKAIAAEPQRRAVVFSAYTGHELGHLGLQHFLWVHAELIFGANLWVHVGANFAGAKGDVVLQASNTHLQDEFRSACASHGAILDHIHPPGEVMDPEAIRLHRIGTQVLSVSGSNYWSGHARDTWPGAVNVEKGERMAAAMTDFTRRMAGAEAADGN